MLCIIQARMNSKRFPKKILEKINNKTILEMVYNQVNKSKAIKKIIIATSKSKSDDAVEVFCKKKKFNYYRGNQNNVASRFYNLIKKNNFKYFVRISADSPLIDFKLIDKLAKFSQNEKYDIITNLMPRTYPKGQSVEIIKSNFFIKKYKFIVNSQDKEHVTSYFYRKKNNIKIKSITTKKIFNNLNYSIDYKKDLIKIRKILKKSKNKIPNLVELNKIRLN